MNPTIFIACFAVLMVIVVTWFITLSWLFRRLRTHHPPTYERLGSPSLFWNNSVRNNWLLWKFVWSSNSRELGDSAIVNVVRFMRVFFVCYVALFLVLMLAFFNTALQRAR